MTGATDGYRVVGGPGPAVADLEELAFTCRLLEGAAEHLDAASWLLTRADQTCDPLSPEGIEARRALAAVCEGRSSPWRVADHLRQLAAALRRVVELYTDAESLAHRALRTGVVTVAGELGERPLLAAAVGGVGAGVAVVGAGVAVAGLGRALAVSTVGSVLLGRPDPVGPALVNRARRLAGELPGRLTADGRAELEILAVAAFLRGAAPGRHIPNLRPVPEAARMLLDAVPPAGPTALLRRADPPQLPAPRTVAAVLDHVARSYDQEPTPSRPGTPEGVVSVQQLTHPDGTQAWVIAIPGTEDWGLNDPNAMDSTTNVRLMAALADDMTETVLAAMRESGIAPDEPVLLAGHSQGGMAALSVAAAAGGTYRVRAVVTAGSPDIPRPVPAGLQVRHYRHTEDAVPQLDGTPDRTGSDVTVVTRDLGSTGGPAVATPLQAHDVHGYVETAARADRELAGSPGMRSFDAAARDVLGPPGTTAVTRQFVVTRDPALAATQVPTVRPSG
ncbi:hypothetical protein [Cellulomonas xylanilytica]|uniref:Fungal lipase-like domain-containing protein n=1 Tax=Cellulomonas xylanilytica TaxID=233583 RepID=A0A510V535_9CELL|nr:hypothetical protein [Cellulomonas xylanilytica]GEK21979.1 hypothetical protein CXY01_24990 [Cellulomonas xylanilytica]